ncbi:Calx-beta domain-containing protein [Ahniella affigens]|nr:Calx-beta domain-containing protein [Ahniella affigens]
MQSEKLLKVGGLVAAGLAGTAGDADAATFTVTNTNDSGAGSLRQAVLDAEGAAGADTVEFAANVTGTITLTSGQIAITDAVTINGPGAAVLSVSGNNASRVFYLYNSTPVAVEINDLRITGGGGVTFGGGIINFGQDLTLDGVVIEGNSATAGGGGIAATDIVGGQMDMVIRNSQITGNTSGRDGGGIYFYTSGPTLTIENSVISGNTAVDGGGGIYLYHQTGTFDLTDSTMATNAATNFGGGIYLYQIDGSGLNISRSTLNGNSGSYGGAVMSMFTDTSQIVSNSTVSGNQATAAGGGLFAYYTGAATVTLENATIAGNSAAVGGGVAVYSSASVTATDSIIADNTAATDADISGNFALTRTLVEVPGAATIVDNGGNILNQDPVLGPLADNGGPTFTQVPAFGSPVVDAGNTALAVDQRGNPRPSGAADDIGAVELQASIISLSTAAQSVAEEAGNASVTVQRPAGDGAASVDFNTVAGSASAGSDFTTTSGTLNWAAGDIADKTILVPIVDDAIPEAAEAFTLTLSNPVGGSIGAVGSQTVTINDTDVVLSNVDFLATTTAVGESGGSVLVTLQRTGDFSGAASVTVTSSDGSAAAGADYSSVNTAVNWAAGDGAPKTVTVPILPDLLVEGPEDFTLTVSAPVGAALGTNQSNVVTITDDDFTPVPVNSPWALLAGVLGMLGLGALVRKRRSNATPMLGAALVLGVAGLFTAPSSEAANLERHKVAGVVATARVEANQATVSLASGESITVDASKVEVVDRRGLRGFGTERALADVPAGAAIVLKSVKRADGSYRKVRVVLFADLAAAQAAAAK